MKKLILAAALIATPEVAFARDHHLNLVAGDNQESRLSQGIETVSSYQPNSVVRAIELEELVLRRGQFILQVRNLGDRPFNFGPENVRAELADGTVVSIIDYEQLAHEARSDENVRLFFGVVAAGLNGAASANAGQSSGTIYGSNGYAHYSGYNGANAYVAGSIAAQENRQMFADIERANNAQMQAIRANVRTTTVDPGSIFGGAITFELPRDRWRIDGALPVRFIVTTGDEIHNFLACVYEEPRRNQLRATDQQCVDGLAYDAPPVFERQPSPPVPQLEGGNVKPTPKP